RLGAPPNAGAPRRVEKQPRRADVGTRHLALHKGAMLTREDIEGLLDRLSAESVRYENIEQGLWIVRPGGNLELDVVVHYSPPVVLLRVKVMNIPADNGRCADLNRRLLELNANDLVHGAYGISQDSIVLTEALELEHLDYEEFLAAYESMTLALASHLRELASYREGR